MHNKLKTALLRRRGMLNRFLFPLAKRNYVGFECMNSKKKLYIHGSFRQIKLRIVKYYGESLCVGSD